MKPITMLEQDSVKITPRIKEGGCCAPPSAAGTGHGGTAGAFRAGDVPVDLRGAVTGEISTTAGPVPMVSPALCPADRWGEIKCRLSAFRDSYAVPPGLYAVGNPGRDSDVLVSANYKLSFDMLRRELTGRSLWILVINTEGINVWCAAGEGTFGTEELARRIGSHGLEKVVAHRRIIVPQLGAPGVSAAEVRKRTGFRVHFGPVRAADLPTYLDAGLRAEPGMRAARFGFVDRLVLTPMELIPVMKKVVVPVIVLLALLGLEPSGIIFRTVWTVGVPMLLLALSGVLAGAFLTPLFLPFIPFRSFAVKGFLAGAAVNALLVHGAGVVPRGDAYLAAFSYLLFPALSSYLALQFTGATAFTGISGVKKELKYALPVLAVLAILSLAALAAYKLAAWGIL